MGGRRTDQKIPDYLAFTSFPVKNRILYLCAGFDHLSGMKKIILLITLLALGFGLRSQQREAVQNQSPTAKKKTAGEFNPAEAIMEHIADSHEWRLWGEGDHGLYIPLPVILIDHGLRVFSSSKFHQDRGVVSQGGYHYARYHGKVYRTGASGEIRLDAEGHPTNYSPLDLSITKNVAAMLLALLILITLFSTIARAYAKGQVPRGLASFAEPIILFIRDDIAIPNIGEKKYKRFLPYLLTLFFFIWVCNMLGLLPGAANVTGNIAVTFALALLALIVILMSGNKAYWKHIFWMPGVPVPFKIILAPIEVLGIFTKPFALMIRLFANMTGGHIVVLSLISLIFIFQSIWVSPVSMLLGGFIILLEFLVAFLQAYVFTILTALFIGLATQEGH